MTLRCGGLAVLQPAGRCDRLSAVFRLNCATDNMTWPNRTGGGRGGDNRDYRWSSTPDADRCAVFGIRLGQRPLSRAISLIAFGLLPFSSFPIPVASDAYRGRDRPACRIPCARRGMAHRVRP